MSFSIVKCDKGHAWVPGADSVASPMWSPDGQMHGDLGDKCPVCVYMDRPGLHIGGLYINEMSLLPARCPNGHVFYISKETADSGQECPNMDNAIVHGVSNKYRLPLSLMRLEKTIIAETIAIKQLLALILVRIMAERGSKVWDIRKEYWKGSPNEFFRNFVYQDDPSPGGMACSFALGFVFDYEGRIEYVRDPNCLKPVQLKLRNWAKSRPEKMQLLILNRINENSGVDYIAQMICNQLIIIGIIDPGSKKIKIRDAYVTEWITSILEEYQSLSNMDFWFNPNGLGEF